MQFQTLGTVSNYVKMMKLDMQYQKRKENPFLAKGREGEDPVIRQLKQQAEQTRKANTAEAIMGKVKAGLRLSSSEMEYLRENHPEQYQQVMEIEKERAEYRRELEQCRTKEDVQKLNQRKMTQFQSEAKTIASNPNIPKGEKLALLEKIQMRMANIQNEHTTFTDTPEYSALPEDDRERERKPKPVGTGQDSGADEDPLRGITLESGSERAGTTAVSRHGEHAEAPVVDTGEAADSAGKAPVYAAGRAYDASGSPAHAHSATKPTVSLKV